MDNGSAGTNRRSTATTSGVGVLDRAVLVLEALAGDKPVGLSALVAATGLPRATVHRLAVALTVHGLAGRTLDGRFRLGTRLLEWGEVARCTMDVAVASQPALDSLRAQTGESVQLFIREGDARRCVATSERSSGLRDTVPLGALLPLDAGSGGHVLRAFGAGAVPTELSLVRAAGWAASVAERETGVASVSAPVLDADGRALAAVCVSGPVQRLGLDPGAHHASRVMAAAREIEGALGIRRSADHR